tara:strand:+ start:926 stop:1162 length:237 start_codon:yes stop_codon:yes gene_type:complete
VSHQTPNLKANAMTQTIDFSQTLNETLADFGYTTAAASRAGAKNIIDTRGRVVATGRAHEIWAWLIDNRNKPQDGSAD